MAPCAETCSAERPALGFLCINLYRCDRLLYNCARGHVPAGEDTGLETALLCPWGSSIFMPAPQSITQATRPLEGSQAEAGSL